MTDTNKSPRLRTVDKVKPPFPLNQFPADFGQKLGKEIVYLLATKSTPSLEGSEWEQIFASCIGAEWKPSNVGLDDVILNVCAWGAKTVKSPHPHRAETIRLISGRNSPSYSFDQQNLDAAAIDYSKLANLSVTGKVLQSNGSSKVDVSAVNISDVVSLTNASNADSLHNHAVLQESMVAGEAFASGGIFAVRMRKAADAGGTNGRVYKAAKDASVADDFHVIGIALPDALKADGDSMLVIKAGKLTKTGHGFTVGEPIFLGASGALSSTAPSAIDEAVVKIGVARDANIIEVMIQVMGVN